MNTQEILLARQPILNSQMEIAGYELLCRPIPQDSRDWQISHGDRATSEVLISAFNDIGIEDVTEGKPAYVNFTTHWLQNPPIMPCVNMVAEILEHIEPTPENLQAIKALKDHGYQVAIDDYTGDPALVPMFPFIDIVKIDIRALSDLSQLAEIIQRYASYDLIWLAEKVETQEEFDTCKAAGCTLFQGYFFSRPANVYGKRLPDNAVSVISLIRALNVPDAKIKDISAIIQSDPQLSYKLLKIINSASVGFGREVSSISQGIVLAGLNRLKAWANLIALGKLQNKPEALREQAVVRAHLARSLAQNLDALDEDTAFTLGLFSPLDAFLDSPIQDICKQLNLSEELRNALISMEGDYGFILRTVICMEQADWDAINWQRLETIGVTPANTEILYLESLHIARQILASERS